MMYPAILVAKQMNLPLETVCNTLSLHMLRGVAKESILAPNTPASK